MKNIPKLAVITVASTMLSYSVSQADMTDEVLGLEAAVPTSTSRWACTPDHKTRKCICRSASGVIRTADFPKEKPGGEPGFETRAARHCAGVQEWLNSLPR